MRKSKAIFITLCGALAIGRHRSQVIDKQLPKNFQKILILSSGGTMGLAWQLATIQKYEDANILELTSYDLAIGTSAGSIAALLLGSEKNVKDIAKDLTKYVAIMEEELKSAKRNMFTHKNWRRTLNSFSGGKFPHFGLLFSSILNDGTNNLSYIEKYVNTALNNSWPTRETWVMVADIRNGKREILNRGSGLTPGTAAIASSAVPALFESISHGEKQYIDGGIISSSHLDLALRLKSKEVTLLTISQGFVNPFTSRNLLKILNTINQNIEELNIIKAKLWGKITNTKITIIRPTVTEGKILRTNRLMDSTMLEHLVTETLKPTK